MKYLIFAADLLLTVALAALVYARFGVTAAFLVIFALGALTAPVVGQLNAATLILPRLLQRVMEAYTTRLPMLKYFSFDVSPEKVKFEQDIIAQMPLMPKAISHVPGDDMTVGAQNVKDLLTDVPMKIDKARRVILKLPVADAVRLELDPTFDTAVQNAGRVLAESVVGAALGTIAASNFTHTIVEAAVDVDRDTLSKAREQLTRQKAGTPRFGITALNFMSQLNADPRIASRDYHAKLIEEDPYLTLENVEGFKMITEFTDFPDNTFTSIFTADAATDLITISTHNLVDGTKVRVSSTTTLPAGLAAATDYFVRDALADTFKLSATLGGAAINITDAGTGTHSLVRAENLEAFFFDPRAILIAIRQLNDNIETARRLGIPIDQLVETYTEEQTGLTFTGYMWIDKKHDIYAAFVVAFGVRGGRQGSVNAADSLLDRSAVRVVTA